MLTFAASDVELSRLYRDMTRDLRIPATISVRKSFKTRWHAFWQGCKKLAKQVICKLFTDWEVRLEAVLKLDQYWSAKNTVSCFLQKVFLKHWTCMEYIYKALKLAIFGPFETLFGRSILEGNITIITSYGV